MLSKLPTDFRGCSITNQVTHLLPPFDSSTEAEEVIAAAEQTVGEVYRATRIGSADSCWFKDCFDLVIDGLGPRGDAEHSAHEYIEVSSILTQYELAESLADQLLQRVGGLCRPVPISL